MKRIDLFAIDFQNSFCDPKGELYVPGAEQDAKRTAGFDQYIEVDNVNENSIAKLANFISKSVSSQSSSLGGGSKSKTIAF